MHTQKKPLTAEAPLRKKKTAKKKKKRKKGKSSRFIIKSENSKCQRHHQFIFVVVALWLILRVALRRSHRPTRTLPTLCNCQIFQVAISALPFAPHAARCTLCVSIVHLHLIRLLALHCSAGSIASTTVRRAGQQSIDDEKQSLSLLQWTGAHCALCPTRFSSVVATPLTSNARHARPSGQHIEVPVGKRPNAGHFSTLVSWFACLVA
jgi:hypothetical protein